MNPEQFNQNTSNLTPAELDTFLKLPIDQQEKEKDDRLVHLKALNDQLDLAIQEAIKTGKIGETQKLIEQLRQGIQDLEQEIEATEKPPEPELVWLELPFPYEKMLVVPDPEITSAKTAMTKLEAQGYKISDYAKEMLAEVNWQEKLDPSYKIVSFSVADLFGDRESHTYADIKAKAKEHNLGLVPSALAPKIRLNYDKNGSYTAIAMNALSDRGGSLRLFDCYEDGSDLWLSSDRGRDDKRWNGLDRFFFVSK